MALAVNVPEAIARLQAELADLNSRLPSMRQMYTSRENALRGVPDQTLIDMGLQITAVQERIADIGRQLQQFQFSLNAPTPTQQEPQTGGGYPLPSDITVQPQTGGGYPLPPVPGKPSGRPVIKRYIVRVSNAWRNSIAAQGKNPDDEIRKRIPAGAPFSIQSM
ncbi:hypothetical protein EBT31_12190 [bacterium]|nr:hypothetical protein [bacterium]